jgi:hypothetical protein
MMGRRKGKQTNRNKREMGENGGTQPLLYLLQTYCFYKSNTMYQVIVRTWDAKGDLVEGLKDEEKALS